MRGTLAVCAWISLNTLISMPNLWWLYILLTVCDSESIDLMLQLIGPLSGQPGLLLSLLLLQ